MKPLSVTARSVLLLSNVTFLQCFRTPGAGSAGTLLSQNSCWRLLLNLLHHLPIITTDSGRGEVPRSEANDVCRARPADFPSRANICEVRLGP